MNDPIVTSVIIAGVGGQGIVTASDILSGALHRHGYDVKKSEIHGMSQRGGSVSSDIRFGQRVMSPMVPVGTADYLVVMDETQVGPNQHMLRPGGVLITPHDAAYILESDGGSDPHTEKLLNVALLGVLSVHLDVPESCWLDALRDVLSERLHRMNEEAFQKTRAVEAFALIVADASTSPRKPTHAKEHDQGHR